MATKVTLCDATTGEKTRYFLSSDGRVDVDTVLQTLGATQLKLDDGDGCFSVLQKGPDGLSLNIFNPGDVINVHPVFQPQAQLPQTSYPVLSSSAPVAMDVDWPSVWLGGGDLVSEIDESAHVFTKVFTWTEFKAGKLLPRAVVDPQEALVKCKPCEWRMDHGWDDVYTPSQQSGHMQTLATWLQLPASSKFTWLGVGIKANLKKVFNSRTVIIGSKNSEVLADTSRGIYGAVLGVNIYKRLTWHSIFRTHLEYLLWATTSQVPHIQLLTDMNTGGLFYACKEGSHNKSVIWIVVLEDMIQVQEFFCEFGKSLPGSVNEFTTEQQTEFKTLPQRFKLPYPGMPSPIAENVV